MGLANGNFCRKEAATESTGGLVEGAGSGRDPAGAGADTWPANSLSWATPSHFSVCFANERIVSGRLTQLTRSSCVPLCLLMSDVLQADVCPVPPELHWDLATHLVLKDERKNTYLTKQILLNCCGQCLAWFYGFLQLALISWFTLGTKEERSEHKSRQEEIEIFLAELKSFEIYCNVQSSKEAAGEALKEFLTTWPLQPEIQGFLKAKSTESSEAPEQTDQKGSAFVKLKVQPGSSRSWGCAVISPL